MLQYSSAVGCGKEEASLLTDSTPAYRCVGGCHYAKGSGQA